MTQKVNITVMGGLVVLRVHITSTLFIFSSCAGQGPCTHHFLFLLFIFYFQSFHKFWKPHHWNLSSPLWSPFLSKEWISFGGIAVIPSWLVFLALPSVSAACCQHSNQSGTVKMCIRSSVLHLELPQSLLSYSEKSTSLEWLKRPSRMCSSRPTYAPITSSHFIFCYSSLCSLYSGHTDYSRVFTHIFVELKRPGPVSGIHHFPFPLPGALYTIEILASLPLFL